MDRGAWWATVHGVAKSQTRLSLRLYSRKTGWKNAVGVKCQSTASFSFPPLNGVNPFRHWVLKNKPGKLQLGLPEREAGSPWLWAGQVGRGSGRGQDEEGRIGELAPSAPSFLHTKEGIPSSSPCFSPHTPPPWSWVGCPSTNYSCVP